MLEPDLSALLRLVERATGAKPLDAVAMPGGASTRRYLRLRLRSVGNGAPGSAVGMFVPDAATPEEVTSGAASARWPFLEIRDLLASRGVKVPRLYGEDCPAGWVLLEDLGDDTVAAVVARAPARREEIYRRAVHDLARAHQALAELPVGSVVASRAFEVPLLRWELDHFREWGLDARGVTLSPSERAAFDGHFARLAARVAALPRGFVHRDYQSRNLMVREGPEGTELVWIDFQDALLGPRVYDLVALLEDSYQEFDDAFREARLDEYAAERGLDRQDREALGREYDLVTVQRKLKDAGRFVYIERVKDNPAFLPYVAPTLGKVRRALARLDHDPEMRDLAGLLQRLLERA